MIWLIIYGLIVHYTFLFGIFGLLLKIDRENEIRRIKNEK